MEVCHIERFDFSKASSAILVQWVRYAQETSRTWIAKIIPVLRHTNTSAQAKIPNPMFLLFPDRHRGHTIVKRTVTLDVVYS